jgi:hypothetical protein
MAASAGPYPCRIPFIFAVTFIIHYLDRNAIAYALPEIAQERDWTDQQLGDWGQYLLGAFFLTFGLSQIAFSGGRTIRRQAKHSRRNCWFFLRQHGGRAVGRIIGDAYRIAFAPGPGRVCSRSNDGRHHRSQISQENARDREFDLECWFGHRHRLGIGDPGPDHERLRLAHCIRHHRRQRVANRGAPGCRLC